MHSLLSETMSQSLTHFIHEADLNYELKNYSVAAANYKKAWQKVIQDMDILNRAANAFYEAGQQVDAIQAYEILAESSSKYEKNSYKKLAEASKEMENFRDAASYYKLYYKKLKTKNKERLFIKNEILRCLEGARLAKQEPVAIVESIGANINSNNEEYNIIPSVNFADKFYFSAIREDNEGGRRNNNGIVDLNSGILRADLYIAEKENGTWRPLKKMNTLINGTKNDMILEFINHGESMVYFQSWDENYGEIKIHNLSSDPDKFIDENLFQGLLFGEIGDKYMSVFQDSVIIFSSKRMGGYGGYDLYISLYREGHWLSPKNMGNKINTPFNEISPFIAKDGHTVYFSSDNLSSIGGYDIFRTQFKAESGLWDNPENIGLPVNSGSNDFNFRLTPDGLSGVFTSDRKKESKGNRDIFIAYFKEELEEQFYASSGTTLSFLFQDKLNSSPKDFVPVIKNEPKELRQYRDYVLESIYYSDDKFIKDPKTIKTLEQIHNMMKINPELSVEIFGHAYEENSAPLNLYYSIKRAEQVSSQLIESGISKDKIQVYGIGNFFPLAKPEIGNDKNLISEKWNKRIDWNIITSDTSSARISYATPVIPEYLRVSSKINLKKIFSGLCYTILIGESEQIFNHEILKQKDHPTFVYYNPKLKRYQYFIGMTSSFREIESIFTRLKENSKFKIIPLHNGTMVDRIDVINYVTKYPDLILYINYHNNQE